MSRAYEINNGNGVVTCITVGDDIDKVIDHEIKQATDSLRAQLTETAAREAAMRQSLEQRPGHEMCRPNNCVFATEYTNNDPYRCPVRALSLKPSRACAVYDALVKLEQAARSLKAMNCQCYASDGKCPQCVLRDALAVVAKARSGK